MFPAGFSRAIALPALSVIHNEPSPEKAMNLGKVPVGNFRTVTAGTDVVSVGGRLQLLREATFDGLWLDVTHYAFDRP